MNYNNLEELENAIKVLEEDYEAYKKTYKIKVIKLGLMWFFSVFFTSTSLFINIQISNKPMLLINILSLIIAIVGIEFYFMTIEKRKLVLKNKKTIIDVLLDKKKLFKTIDAQRENTSQ